MTMNNATTRGGAERVDLADLCEKIGDAFPALSRRGNHDQVYTALACAAAIRGDVASFDGACSQMGVKAQDCSPRFDDVRRRIAALATTPSPDASPDSGEDDERRAGRSLTAVAGSKVAYTRRDCVEAILAHQRMLARAASPASLSGRAEEVARRFHDTYERLAPAYGYETRTDTKVFDPTSANGRLMIAVCAEIAHPSPEAPANRQEAGEVEQAIASARSMAELVEDILGWGGAPREDDLQVAYDQLSHDLAALTSPKDVKGGGR